MRHSYDTNVYREFASGRGGIGVSDTNGSRRPLRGPSQQPLGGTAFQPSLSVQTPQALPSVNRTSTPSFLVNSNPPSPSNSPTIGKAGSGTVEDPISTASAGIRPKTPSWGHRPESAHRGFRFEPPDPSLLENFVVSTLSNSSWVQPLDLMETRLQEVSTGLKSMYRSVQQLAPGIPHVEGVAALEAQLRALCSRMTTANLECFGALSSMRAEQGRPRTVSREGTRSSKQPCTGFGEDGNFNFKGASAQQLREAMASSLDASITMQYCSPERRVFFDSGTVLAKAEDLLGLLRNPPTFASADSPTKVRTNSKVKFSTSGAATNSNSAQPSGSSSFIQGGTRKVKPKAMSPTMLQVGGGGKVQGSNTVVPPAATLTNISSKDSIPEESPLLRSGGGQFRGATPSWMRSDSSPALVPPSPLVQDMQHAEDTVELCRQVTDEVATLSSALDQLVRQQGNSTPLSTLARAPDTRQVSREATVSVILSSADCTVSDCSLSPLSSAGPTPIAHSHAPSPGSLEGGSHPTPPERGVLTPRSLIRKKRGGRKR